MEWEELRWKRDHKAKDGSCIACHKNKTKCSVRLPSCERCLSLNITCQYWRSGDYFSTLQRNTAEIMIKLDRMEQELARLRRVSEATTASARPQTDLVINHNQVQPNQVPETVRQSRFLIANWPSEVPRVSRVRCEARKTAYMSAQRVTSDIRITPNKFTIQTNVHSLADLYALLFHRLSEKTLPTESKPWLENSSNQGSDSIALPKNKFLYHNFSKDVILNCLNTEPPPRESTVSLEPFHLRYIASNCINVYFGCFNRKFPILNQNIFTTYYRKMNDPLDSLVVLSLASLMSEPALVLHARHFDRAHVKQISRHFFDRAFSLLMDIFDEPKVSTVYTLTYLTQYCFIDRDAKKPTRPYSLYGLAVRMAQQLGFFDGRGGEHQLVFGQSQKMQQEMTLRLGWVLYRWDFDITVTAGFPSMLLGRPPTISSSPLDCEDNDERASLEFFLRQCQCDLILRKVRTMLYKEADEMVQLPVVTALETEVEDYYKNTPPRFYRDQLSRSNSTMDLLVLLNQVSYHHMIIELHKQFIPSSSEDITAPNESMFQLCSMKKCLKSALRLNEIFCDMFERELHRDISLGTFFMALEILTKIAECKDLTDKNKAMLVQVAKWNLSKHLVKLNDSIVYELDWKPWRECAQELKEFLLKNYMPTDF
ncbi:hypothetical protein BC937DRAFT_88641 [Endogone sp. FLAS-F59071]|nr:hypothetical protein BC937DRAFT_88641 [Endogone sp. FLAS-F59071]|eukprot:RUS18538.1 hypothetical protein BC937DRAFT_88641 [Endogone sp. FLAS-F59071]